MGRSHAFSLLEVMVTLAILAIVAALAVPSLLPEVQKAQLTTSVDAVAAFIGAARDEAMLQRRCTRLRLDPPDGPADVLVIESSNSLTCEDVVEDRPLAGRRIDPLQPPWVETRRLKLESPRLEASFTAELPVFEIPQLRFRPTGRVWTNDSIVSDDNVSLTLLHPVLQRRRHVLVMSNGFICTPLPGVIDEGDDPSTFTCGDGT